MRKNLLKAFIVFSCVCLFSLQLLAQVPPPPGGDPMAAKRDQSVVNNISPAPLKFIMRKLHIIKQSSRITFHTINWIANGKKNFKKSFFANKKISEAEQISFFPDNNFFMKKTAGFQITHPL